MQSDISLLLELLKVALSKSTAAIVDESHWKVGETYFIRTVTHHYTGTLVKVTEKELVLNNAAWIADDGLFSQAVESGDFNEVEPFPSGEVIVGRGALLDACARPFPPPRKQK